MSYMRGFFYFKLCWHLHWTRVEICLGIHMLIKTWSLPLLHPIWELQWGKMRGQGAPRILPCGFIFPSLRLKKQRGGKVWHSKQVCIWGPDVSSKPSQNSHSVAEKCLCSSQTHPCAFPRVQENPARFSLNTSGRRVRGSQYNATGLPWLTPI